MASGPGADRGLTDRTVAAALVVAGCMLVAWLLVALVPWSDRPGPVGAASVFTTAEIDQAEAFGRLSRLIGWSSLAVSLVVAAWLGFTRRGARLLGRFQLPWWASVVVLTFLVSGIGWLARLPIAVMSWQQRTRVGLTTQPFSGVLRDEAVGFAIGVVFAAIALLVLIGLARALPRAWPAAAAVAGSVVVVASSWLYPVLVEPAFNTFEPVQDPTLVAAIQRLADAEGVQVGEVLVADASRRTTSLNAYVSGFGSSRRVVLYDTLLDQMDRREVLSVVAHELSHARHQDVETGTILGVGGTVLGVGLLGLFLASPGVRRRVGVAGPGDPRVVALLLALGAWGSVAISPLESGVSRQLEIRADRDALKATGDPVAFKEMQHALAVAALSDPTPPAWSQWWFGSHPTVLERIALTRQR